ncbi:MAG: ATP-dependent endonuclease [Heliobacteriaceae bacterium]|jgi:hypothetical protein|nr:ATP-dependent endonuclease [Heliobacteriaceae bacterium]
MHDKLKVKPLTQEQILISIDRLTRFKETETKYLRVFKDIITNGLIEPKFGKKELDAMDYEKLRDYAQYVLNSSIETAGFELSDDYIINLRLFDNEKALFDINENIKKLLVNNINYMAILPLINKKSPLNLRWLKELAVSMDLVKSRQEKKLLFPLEKIVLAEGATEEILLPEFAKLCGYDFNENGVYVVSAGGKNQVVKYFYKIYQSLKIPVFILLDNDAVESTKEIQPKLRIFDRIYLIKSGEFEDLLPLPLVKKTLNNMLRNFCKVKESDLARNLPAVKKLEEFFRKQGLPEFKKADFARAVKENIVYKSDVSDEIEKIIKEIKEH